MTTFGEKLVQLRTTFQISQKAFAAALGIHNSLLSNLEGDKVLPKKEVVEKLSQFVGIDMVTLLDETVALPSSLDNSSPAARARRPDTSRARRSASKTPPGAKSKTTAPTPEPEPPAPEPVIHEVTPAHIAAFYEAQIEILLPDGAVQVQDLRKRATFAAAHLGAKPGQLQMYIRCDDHRVSYASGDISGVLAF